MQLDILQSLRPYRLHRFIFPESHIGTFEVLIFSGADLLTILEGEAGDIFEQRQVFFQPDGLQRADIGSELCKEAYSSPRADARFQFPFCFQAAGF
ncbi:MAG: hypothetical protein IPL49_18115 [Saprospirales bacterium]|nr:hypothetical protein [Saprospirales bacterium]